MYRQKRSLDYATLRAASFGMTECQTTVRYLSMQVASAGEAGVEAGIPPGVIDIDGDTERGAAGVKPVGDVQRLSECVHRSAIGGIHRMQRFQRQRYPGPARMGQQLGDAVLRSSCGRRQYPWTASSHAARIAAGLRPRGPRLEG